MEAGYTSAEQELVRRRVAPFDGWRVEFHERLPSTQDVCRQRAAGGEHLCVVASHQTKGRGRLGRTWDQPPEVDISFSVVLAPAGRYPELLLPFLCGAAVWRTAGTWIHAPLRLKWPNDLLASERKLAGILIEGAGVGRWACGIGLNVNRTTFPTALAGQATSLRLETERELDRAEVLAELLGTLAALARDAEAGRAESSVAWFNEGLGLAGRAVVLEAAGRELRGVLERVSPQGVQLAGGPLLAVGEVASIVRSGSDP